MSSHPLQSAPIRAAISAAEESREMARRRYQNGSVRERGKREKVWEARYRIDVIRPDGTRERQQKTVTLGTKKELRTKRDAQRALEAMLSREGVNRSDYKPRVQIRFSEFAQMWENSVLSQKKPSYQASEKSRLRTHISPFFAEKVVADITVFDIQQFIASVKVGPKTKKNLFATLRSLHKEAKRWNLTTEDWITGTTLPDIPPAEVRHYTVSEVRRMLQAATEPEHTWLWLLAELGGRLGEVCALRPRDFDLDRGIVTLRYSAWRSTHVGSTKSKRPREFNISPELAEHLRDYCRDIAPDAFIFARDDGTAWQGDHAVRDRLKPLLRKLNIPEGGAHAFRHFNVTELMSSDIPLSVIQDRVGHVDQETTMRYTHSRSSDHRRAAELMGRILTQHEGRVQ